MRIDVTQHDIDTGERGRCSSCPIARAIRRAFDQPSKCVAVYPGVVYMWGRDDKSVKAELPAEATAFINRFDAGWAVEPFSFALDV